MPYEFSQRSEAQIETLHRDLRKVLREAILWTPVDFGVSEGHRSVERQFALWQQGRKQLEDGSWTVVGPVVTNIDGVSTKGKHNVFPSHAFDIFGYAEGRDVAYDPEHIAAVAGVLLSTAERLYKTGAISHRLRWGADWDKDGLLVYDHRFVDRPHFELI